MFRVPEARAMFEEMWRYYHDPRHYAETPKRGWMEQKFQGFAVYPGIEETTEELIEYVRRDTLQQRLHDTLVETYDLIGDPYKAVNELHQRTAELKSMSATKKSNFMIHEVTEEIWERYCEKKRLRLAGGVSGIPWPWTPLNEVTNGMEKEQLVIIFGQEKSMKTMFAIQLAVYAYLWANQRVLLYSAEMPREDMQDRMAACIAELDYGRIDRGSLNAEEEARYQEALQFIREEAMENPSGHGPLLYYASDQDADTRGSVSLVRAYAEEIEADLIVVDSFYRLADDRSGTVGLDWKNVGNVTQDLKALAKQRGVPVIGVTQANEVGKLAFSKVIGMETDLAMHVELSEATMDYTDLDLTFTASRKIRQPGFRLRVQPYTRFSWEGWLDLAPPTERREANRGQKSTEFGKSRRPPKGPPVNSDASAIVNDLVARHLM